MDRSTIVGFGLILLLFFAWQYTVAPSPEELEAQQRRQDSLVQYEQAQPEAAQQPINDTIDVEQETAELTDSARQAQFSSAYGAFATAVDGTEEFFTLENDLMIVTLSNKGGRITEVELKNYQKMMDDGETVTTSPLYLLNDEKNRFEYELPVAGTSNGVVRSSDLYFQPEANGNTVVFRAMAANGGYFEQRYSLEDSTYLIDYDLNFNNLQQILSNNTAAIRLHWENYLEKIEKNAAYEANYSSVYYKPMDDDPNHCGCMSDDVQDVDGEPLKWVSHTQQFFTSALFADNSFKQGVMETRLSQPEQEDLKLLVSDIAIPYGRSSSEQFGMRFYVGPNEFDRMRAIGHDFSDVIPYGASVFGAINRWVIRPLFNFLNSFIGRAGISILLLTLLVKLMVYPLTFKMLKSNAKMQVLKPEIEKLKKKHDGDKQALQMETMKMYQEYGASPLGGCFPMLLQLPIWIALYRYFPAAIEFRQESFLWANDLSTYDSIMGLPSWIPFMGGHLSLFAVLWAVTTLIYAYYNSKHMDFSAQPMMKYFQYVMPVLFLGFFNSFAAGLTCYLFFSNVFNISQTIITKNYLIDNEGLLQQLNANKAKPKKKSGFRARLEEAMKEQQRIQAEQQAKKGRKKK
ncbi:MAG: membrane protein insertase YidC [Bacteroidota bacterium]